MKKFAVIGHPVAHSKSPQIHQAGFQEFGIEASFEKIDIAPEELENWVKKDFCEQFAGVAVTLPHKIEIRKYIDRESEAAQKMGAVNTLINNDGVIEGTNTDAVGVLKALETVTDVKEKRVLVLGAGGAARAAVFALKTAGAQVAVWNRTVEKAQTLADEFEVGVVKSLDEVAQIAEKIDIFVNTVSLKAGKFWPENLFSQKDSEAPWFAFDASYEPLETMFLLDAEAHGAEIITGDKMLVYQAIEQFKLWHGIEPEPEVFEDAFFV